ncbi:hypothetical protein SETIT_4G241100v2 [Setaria italica]|uniref:DUF3615 domain-containing protein n=1 Tax=Setaria italica TaxID=4555 RepID=A0A368QXL8_SETIT|nr:hypothetical protein SETIT_4G241100v2 [Setaria italica]
MVRTADPPHAAGGLDPHGQGHLCSHPVALDHLSIGTRGPGGYPTSLSAAVHPVGRAAGSSGGRHWPPYHAYSLNQRECYGAYDPIDHRPPPFDGHPPDHRDRARGAGGFSASMPPPPAHRPAGYDVDSPSVVPAPDRHMISSGASSGRPLRPRRESDISPVPSALIRSTQGEGYREHQHHRARDESGHSPRFHSPLRGSKSVPLPERHRSEDGRKGSKSLPSAKRYRFEDGRKGSPSGRHWYDDGERCGSRGRYADGRHTQEMAYPSSCDQGLHNLGDSKRNLSPHDHGESVQHHLSLRVNPPSPMPMEMSPWDDGYKSPTSPTYRCEDVEQGSRDEDKNETPGWLDSDYDASGISGRDSNFKIEDPVLKTKEDSAYTELVDDFMDAVMKSWRDPNPNIRVDKEADQKLADSRFAELALKRYNKNKNNKVKYALIEAIADAVMFEASGLYRHVNFYAKAKNGPKKNDGKVLVFAELHQIGYRPNAMALTCFRLLDENNQLCGRRDQIRSCHMIQDQDKGHCYACSDRIKHPDGSCYKAGHFASICYYHNN